MPMSPHDPYTPVVEALLEDLRDRLGRPDLPREMVLQSFESTHRFIRQLRQAFEQCPCRVDYGDEHLRAAYLIAYYPNYIEPIYRILEGTLAACQQVIGAKKSLRVSLFGAGPAPELVGLAAFCRDYCSDVKGMRVAVFDACDAWTRSRSIASEVVLPRYWNGTLRMQAYTCDFRTCDQCGPKECTHHLEHSQLVIAQNCLNELVGDPSHAAAVLLSIIARTERDALFVVCDLNYDEIADVMRAVQDRAVHNGLAICLQPVQNAAVIHRSNLLAPEWLGYMFTGENRLIRKKKTNYYSLVLQRTQRPRRKEG